MKQIFITKHGTTDVLKIVEQEDIAAKDDDDVIIKVKAIGINFADTLMRVGFYPEAPPLPFVPGYECAGIVESVGKDVKKVKKGDNVLALTKFGSYATLSRAKENKTFILPKNIDFIKGAAIPINYLTAWIALNEFARVREKEHVLIHSCAGGVGLAAVQIASDKNCVIYGTAGSDKKCEFLKKNGVSHPINYKKADFVKEIKKISPSGVDIILDSVGFEYLPRDREILNHGGKIITFGLSGIKSGKKKNPIHTFLKKRKNYLINPISLIFKNHGIIGLNVLPMWDKGEFLENCLDLILKKVEAGNFDPTIAREFSFEEVGEAHTYIEERKNIGKVVLKVE
ncbi:MAG: zinc-binding dehydrogenase [Nanoarchaeota archaeon]